MTGTRWVTVDDQSLVELFIDKGETPWLYTSKNGLPDDAELVNVRWDAATLRYELLVASEQWEGKGLPHGPMEITLHFPNIDEQGRATYPSLGVTS